MHLLTYIWQPFLTSRDVSLDHGVWSFKCVEFCFLIFIEYFCNYIHLRYWFLVFFFYTRVSLMSQLVKNLPAVWEIWVRSLGWEGKGYPLQYSGLENSMDCIVHGVAKSQTWVSNFHFKYYPYLFYQNSATLLKWFWNVFSYSIQFFFF